MRPGTGDGAASDRRSCRKGEPAEVRRIDRGARKSRLACQEAQRAEKTPCREQEAAPQFVFHYAEAVQDPPQVDYGWRRLIWTTFAASLLMVFGVASVARERASSLPSRASRRWRPTSVSRSSASFRPTVPHPMWLHSSSATAPCDDRHRSASDSSLPRRGDWGVSGNLASLGWQRPLWIAFCRLVAFSLGTWA